MPEIVYISIGSNLGDRRRNLKKAVELLGAVGDVTKISALYCTEPVGFKEQAEFMNAVIEMRTRCLPFELLYSCQKIENQMGRRRDIRWGPRNIDIDLLFYGDMVINSEQLILPHPLLQDRRFVLVPLSEVAPDAFHPLLKKTAQQLLAECSDAHRVEKCGSLDSDP